MWVNGSKDCVPQFAKGIVLGKSGGCKLRMKGRERERS